MQKPSDAGSLRALANQKEKEWRDVQELRADSLEVALQKTQKDLAEERAKFLKLKDDFKYNLRLLADRDSELEKYDSSTTGIKAQLMTKEAEISDLKIKIDELKSALQREAESKSAMQALYQQRVRDKQESLESYRGAKDSEVNNVRAEFERIRHDLEMKVTELDEEINAQRNELNAGFEDGIHRREQEYRRQIEDMSCTVLSHELKVKLLQKELDQANNLRHAAVEDSEVTEKSHRELLNEIKHKEWEIEDVKAMKKAKITELEVKLQNSEHKMKQFQEEYIRKHADVDKRMKEKEQALLSARQSAKEAEEQRSMETREMQAELEEKDVELRDLKWHREDYQRETNAKILSLQDELQDSRTRTEKEISEKSQSQLAKDHELMVLREVESKLKKELTLRRRDIERYKKELQSGMEREASAERNHTQLDLGWQRRYDDVERQQFQKSEDLVRTLSSARDEAAAEAKQCKRELEHQADLVQMLHKERNEALVTLKKHGLIIDKNIDIDMANDVPPSAADHIKELENQNENLRLVIRQMREQIENIDEGQGSSTGRASSVAEDYIRNVEDELKSLKAKHRKLKDEFDDIASCNNTEKESVVNKEALNKVLSGNDLVKVHVQQLNEQIGNLRHEKVTLTTLLRKQQTRISFFEKQMEETSRAPREKQVALEQLQYKIGACERQHQAEVASLKQRASDADLQAAEARKEAEEFHKACLQTSSENTALQNQLSQLKLEFSETRPAVNFGAQELFIQQLQDEIQNLRCQIQGGDPVMSDLPISVSSSAQGQIIMQLQRKLKNAAKQMKELAKEKQQLIDVGNRLRASLNNDRKALPLHHDPHPKTNQLHDAHPKTNQLQQLEHLQYELTKQELALQHQKLTMMPSHDDHQRDDRTPTPSILKNKAKQRSPLSSRSLKSGRESPMRKSKDAEIPVGVSISSVGGESLKEIWKMLDDQDDDDEKKATTPTAAAENSGPFAGIQFPGDQEVKAVGGSSSRDLRLEGSKTKMDAKTKPQSLKLSPRTAGKVIRSHVQKKQMIRNYSLREK